MTTTVSITFYPSTGTLGVNGIANAPANLILNSGPPASGNWDLSFFNQPTGNVPVQYVSINAFKNNTNLVSVTMNNCTGLELASCFEGCTNLQTVNFPNLDYTCQKAFKNCINLTTVNMPKLTYIDRDTFSMTTGPNNSLTTLSFPSLLTIFIDNATAIDDAVFLNLTALTSVGLGKVSTITTTSTKSVFKSCTALQNITIPNTLASLPQNMFVGCTGLVSVITYNVTALGTDTFKDCPSLINIYFNKTPPSGSGSFNNVNSNLKIYRNPAILGWGPTYQGYPVQDLSPTTTITPPTDSLSSTGNLTLTNTQFASSYQWYRNGVAITGATSASYTMDPATDINQNITLQATDFFGNTATSAPNKLVKYIKGSTQVSYKFLF